MAQLTPPELPPGALRRLLAELHTLHGRAGWLSTRKIARNTECGASHTSVYALFTQASDGPPSLPLLLDVVNVLATGARGVDVDQTLDLFDELWRSAAGQGPSTEGQGVGLPGLMTPLVANPNPPNLQGGLDSTDLPVEIRAIVARDGRPGAATHNIATIAVRRVPSLGYRYWLIIHLLRSDGSPYVAKAALRGELGIERHGVQLNDVVGSVRNIFIVEADQIADAALSENHRHELEGNWDKFRADLPVGCRPASQVWRVRKSRS